VALDAPLLDGYMLPAQSFFAAVEACDGVPKLTIKENTLVVSEGKFRARVPLLPGVDYPLIPPPQGDVVGKLSTEPLRRVRDFVATDASRPFACGEYFHKGYVYATNNVTMTRSPVNYNGPDIVIPVQCVDELLRLPFDEYSVQHSESGLYFRPEGVDVWVHTRALDLAWPDVERFFEWDADALPEINAVQLRAGVARLKKFVPDDKVPVICFTDEGLRTLEGSAGDAQIGDSDKMLSSWRAETLELVLAKATHVDFSTFPKPSPWRGEALTGVMMGYRA
jgi:DNA polymerase III sliding clamp (beta) subunit (PCNA family)